MSISMLMLLIAIGFILWLARGLVRWLRHWRKLYGFAHYCADHPDCITGKSVRCHVCRSASIYISRVGYTPFTIRHAHICRRCGETLYYSRANVVKPHDKGR